MNDRRLLSVLAMACLLLSAGRWRQPAQSASLLNDVAVANLESSNQPPERVMPELWLETADGAVTDALIVLSAQADLGRAEHYAEKSSKGRYVYAALWDTAERTQSSLRQWLGQRGIPYRAFYIVNAIEATVDRAALVELSNRQDIAHILTVPHVRLDIADAVARTEQVAAIPWGIQQIRAPELWALGYTGAGVVVAGQDTGYEWDHPALKNAYRGWDGSIAAHDYNWHDAIHEGGGACGPDSPEPCDDYWHGTHTMGTIVGDDGGANQIGAAPDAKWIGCRNMSVGVGTPDTYIECFEFFLAPYPVSGDASQGDPSLAPDIINNSWSCTLDEGCDALHTALLREAVERVSAAGIMVVASAGNYGPYCDTVDEPPGEFDATYSIGATDITDMIASFSSRGTPTALIKPDIAAPGVDVYSSVLNGAYTSSSGTSMASPHIVGALALLWSARPELRGQIDASESLLNLTAVPRYSTQCGDLPDAIPNNVYGWGRVDTYAAFLSMTGVLNGVVSDTDGTPVANTVISAEAGDGAARSTTSDSLGSYSLLLLSGTYTLTATAAGYLPETYTDIVVDAGGTSTLDILMDAPCDIPEGISMDIEPSPPLSRQPAQFAAVVISGVLPITFTWDFGDVPVVGNPVIRELIWNPARTSIPITITASNMCGTGVHTEWIGVAPRQVYLPVLLRWDGGPELP